MKQSAFHRRIRNGTMMERYRDDVNEVEVHADTSAALNHHPKIPQRAGRF